MVEARLELPEELRPGIVVAGKLQGAPLLPELPGLGLRCLGFQQEGGVELGHGVVEGLDLGAGVCHGWTSVWVDRPPGP